jgi:hypothetical protein
MTKYLLLVIAIACLFFGLCCKDNGVTPEDLKPGRRDYVWTVDTLRVPAGDMFTPNRIWGSAPNDIWLTGSGSPSTSLLWHFDGASWKRDSVQKIISPSALWGFASNNIWLGNSNNSFWRYNGIQWNKYSDVTPPSGFDRVAIEDIWGKQSNDGWGVGFADQYNGGTEYKGIIMHFDGSQWDFVQIPTLRISFAWVRRQQSSGLLFLQARRFEQTGDTAKLFVYDGKNLQQIYSSPNDAVLQEVRGEVYLIINQKIYKYINGTLQVWKDFSGTNYIGGMLGRSEIDFLGLRSGGGILHYNGTDMQVLYETTLGVWSWFIFEKDVFIVFYDLENNLNIIVHGKLL